MLAWLDRISLPLLAVAALFLALAPFTPQPHLWEKLNMLAAGTLVRPLACSRVSGAGICYTEARRTVEVRRSSGYGPDPCRSAYG